MKTKIIITDDHKLFAEGLANMLSSQKNIELLPYASSGEELLSVLSVTQVDLVLLDMSMPGLNGLDTSRKIFSRHKGTKVLMVTMHDGTNTLKKLITAGVHGIILKNTGRQELLTAIDEIMHGRNYFSPAITRQLVSDAVPTESTDLQLTRREKEVLQLIYEGYSTTGIAEKLEITSYTVETHRKSLLFKSGCSKSSQLVKLALERGYIQPES